VGWGGGKFTWMVGRDEHEAALRNLRECKGVVYLITCNSRWLRDK